MHQQIIDAMEKNIITQNTNAWRFQVWAAFSIALTITSIGIYHLPVNLWVKGFFIMSEVFLVSSCFALAKTIRDDLEFERINTEIASKKHLKKIRTNSDED